MAYATVAQVQSEFKNMTFSASTSITTDDVTRFITEEEAYLNGRIGSKVSVPVSASATESIAILRSISVQLVKARCNKILEVKTGSEEQDQGAGQSSYRKVVEDDIAMIADGKLLLSDATSGSTADGVKSYNSSNDIGAVFESTTTQW